MAKRYLQLTAVLGSAFMVVAAAGSPAGGGGQAAAAGQAAGAKVSSRKAVSAAECTTDDGPPAGAPMRKTPGGHAEFADWIANPGAQQAMGAIAASNDEAFGKDGKGNSSTTLENGYIGTTLDHRSKSVVVVVDPSVVSLAAVRDRLESVALHASLANSGTPRLSITVKPSCYPAKRLIGIRTSLLAGTWKPAQDHTNCSFGLDPADSTFQVTVSNRPDLLKRLKDTFGPAVTPLNGSFHRLSR